MRVRASLLAIVCLVATSCTASSRVSPTATAPGTVNSPFQGPPAGWTRLPSPPEIRDGAAFVWTGSQLLAWGGCDPSTKNGCVKTADGFVFEPSTRTWAVIPKAPLPGAYARGVWTGSEAIFLGLENVHRLDGEAYDPAAGSWHEIATAPIRPRSGSVTVWTGSELIAWGGGHRGGPAPERGAAYDPAADSWHRIAQAPLGLNLASGMWTGQLMLVFGSLLNGKNWADTPTSVGQSYDPATDTWRELPPSALSPQATSAVWVDHRMVAWDYEVHSQEYDPARNRWSAPVKMPLGFNECYPDSVLVRGLVFASFCGRDALYDASTGTWQEIHGGPLDAEIWSDAYQHDIKLWRFADLVSAGDGAFVAAEGITLTRKGEACYGCAGAPHSFWAYRPPAHVAAVSPSPQPVSPHAANLVAQDFMSARVRGAEGQLIWLITQRASRLFGNPAHGVPEPLLSGTSFRIDRVRPTPGGPGTYQVSVRMFLRGPLRASLGGDIDEILLVGSGRSLGGKRSPLVIVGVRGD